MISYISDKNQDKNYTINILRIIDFMKNEPKNNYDVFSLNTNIQNFRQQIAISIIPKFNGTEEIKPFDAYHELYINLCNESSKYNSYFEESKLLNINNIPGLDSFSSIIIQNLKYIAKTKHSPFYNYFHFIFIETLKCPRCSLIHNFNIKDLFYFEINASNHGNISDMIHNYFNKNEITFYTCNKCTANGPQIKTLYFLTKPKYLIIYFNGKMMMEKNLNDKIDLTQYSYPNMNNNEPNIYSLFAVIKKDNNSSSNFCAFIKDQNIWYFYNAQKIEKCDFVYFESIYPYIAIWDGDEKYVNGSKSGVIYNTEYRDVSQVIVSVDDIFVTQSAVIRINVTAGATGTVRISVNGNQRMDAESVRILTETKVGDNVNNERVNQIAKKLQESGYFSKVNVNMVGGTLKIDVSESPIVNMVTVEGNDDISTDDLKKEIKLKERSSFDQSVVGGDVARMLTVYQRKGYFGTKISPKKISLGDNRVNVVYEISEGHPTWIDSIDFEGNKVFSDRVLRGEILSREYAWWRFMAQFDVYDEDRIKYDQQMLHQFYLRWLVDTGIGLNCCPQPMYAQAT